MRGTVYEINTKMILNATVTPVWFSGFLFNIYLHFIQQLKQRLINVDATLQRCIEVE